MPARRRRSSLPSLRKSAHPLTAITNSLGVARALGASEAITVLLCPGEFRMTEDAVFGPETLAFLDRYHADAAFFGAGGFSAEQVTDADAAGVWVKRKMLERSERACLLADHSKAGQRQFAVVCAAGDLDVLVTGRPLDVGLAGALASANVTVKLCAGRCGRRGSMIVGVDIGTQSLKAVVVTPDLEVLGQHAVAYQPEFPQPGWAQQDPKLWEQALRPAIAGALHAAGCRAQQIQALGIAGQLDGCIPVDGEGLPLHPCLIWMDRRAEAELAGIDAKLIQERCGVVLDATHLAAKIRWLKRHVPAVRDVACFHVPVSYVVSRLTGRRVIDHATASTSMLFGLATQDYDDDLLQLFGIARAELPEPAFAQIACRGADKGRS